MDCALVCLHPVSWRGCVCVCVCVFVCMRACMHERMCANMH